MMEVKSEYKMSELEKIPAEWEIKYLKEVSDSSERYSFAGGPFGSDLTSKEYTECGVRIVQLQNIGEGYFNNKHQIFTTNDKADELMKCNIFPGEILIAKMAEPVARACIVPDYQERYLMSSDAIRLKVNSKKYNTKFLMYSINSNYFRKQAEQNSTGTTRLRIGLTALAKLRVLCPPLEEQQKIAEILSTVDNQIEQTNQLIEKTTELKKGLMQQLLTKGINHTEFKQSVCGIIPNNWTVNKVEYICDYRKEKIDPLKSERQKYIALENIDQGTGRINGYLYSDNSSSMKGVFKKGDTLFNKLRPYLNKYWYATFDGVCATELLPLTAENKTDSLFLYYCLQQERVLGYVTKRTFGTKMPRTSWKELKEILIPIPPIEEQNRIADILSSVDKDIERYEEEKAKYEELKKGLMQQLLTGKTRVKVD